MSKPVSLVQAAATLGQHRNTIAGWIVKGCPVVSRADRGRGVEWQLDVAAVHQWRVDQSVKDAVAGYQTEGGGVSKDEADRRRAVALAIVAEIEADLALKSVIGRADAEAAMADFCQSLRSALSNVGAKVAGRAAGMSRPTEIRELCEAEVNRAMLAAQTELDDRWADPPSVAEESGKDLDDAD